MNCGGTTGAVGVAPNTAIAGVGAAAPPAGFSAAIQCTVNGAAGPANPAPEAAQVNDGGFQYTVVGGGGGGRDAGAEGGLRSYGSMTYAGFKSMLYAGLTEDDPRVKAAVEWLGKRGVRFTPGGVRKGAAGFDVCFIHPKGADDTPIGGEGVLIELVQAPPEVIEAFRRFGAAAK